MALIPAGSFEMGDANLSAGVRPVYRVVLDAFYMDINEVSVGQFREFVEETGYDHNMWGSIATKMKTGTKSLRNSR